ncbi:MAG: type I-E CRISPR-associated protein Cse1/CasA [Armatimonadetes bacterium]|nr:type I-E CRISPR-associated protein Cse1/CasA [Armatimonadota bacterium]
MGQKTAHCNLLVEGWIQILWACGEPGRVGIWDPLTKAAPIRQIAPPNPLDGVALLRFLLAVRRCKPSLTD